MKEELIREYENTEHLRNNIVEESLDCTLDFLDGCRATINCPANYIIRFWNNDNNQLIYESEPLIGEKLAEVSTKKYIKWKIEILIENKIEFEYILDLNNKNVLIDFGEMSLENSIIWFSHILEFMKSHNFNLFIKMKWHFLFKDKYPDIVFIEEDFQYLENEFFISYIFFVHKK